jgi:hypothetical protein
VPTMSFIGGSVDALSLGETCDWIVG